MAPMLIDYIWWRTAGKVEWEDVDEEVGLVIKAELERGNEQVRSLIMQYNHTIMQL